MLTTSTSASTSGLDDGTLKKIAGFTVLNYQKEEILFGSLFEGRKTIVIFIRHFFCGSCRAYITQLSRIVSQDALDKAGTRVILVGSGGPEAFGHYREATGFKGEMFTDPSTKLYRALGMIESTQPTPEGQKRKSYLTSSKLGTLVGSLWEIAKKPSLFSNSAGNRSLNGGELILGPGLQCSFASIMQHTEDHTEVVNLMQAAGVEIAS